MPDYDVAIVGAGPVGAILARRLGAAGARVLVLEAGPAAGRTWAEYEANVEQYRAAGFKVPNSPYYSPPDAPSPNVLDIRKLTPGSLPDDNGYFVQDGPLPFATDYLRSQGGTMLHWLGTCLRMLPNDFEAGSRYGRGRDWPLCYDELRPFYEEAELELGVAADVEDQQYLGQTFGPGYVYPMHRIPPSYLDRCVAGEVDGRSAVLDGQPCELLVSSTPQARNSMPNPHYTAGAATSRSARTAPRTKGSAARATRAASRSARSRPSTTRSRRGPGSRATSSCGRSASSHGSSTPAAARSRRSSTSPTATARRRRRRNASPRPSSCSPATRSRTPSCCSPPACRTAATRSGAT